MLLYLFFPVVKKAWSDEERNAVKNHFGIQMATGMGILPGKTEIEAFIKQTPCLTSRKWSVVKDFIRNNLHK